MSRASRRGESYVPDTPSIPKGTKNLNFFVTEQEGIAPTDLPDKQSEPIVAPTGTAREEARRNGKDRKKNKGAD